MTVSVDELSPVPDANGDCTGQATTGHQQVSLPESATPYIYRFHFGATSTPVCTGRSYVVQVTDANSSDVVIASGMNTCAGTFGSTVQCDVALAFLQPEGGGADDASGPGSSLVLTPVTSRPATRGRLTIPP